MKRRRASAAGRYCERCNVSISQKPQSHALCRSCFYSDDDDDGPSLMDAMARKGGGQMKRRRASAAGRYCERCNVSISQQPQSHTLCKSCFYSDKSDAYSSSSSYDDEEDDDDGDLSIGRFYSDESSTMTMTITNLPSLLTLVLICGQIIS